MNESPPKIREVSFDASLESLPMPVRAIAKYAEIILMLILGLVLIAIGIVVIHTMLPYSRGHMVWVNLIVGFGSLALGCLLICWGCFSCDPAHSDSQPVENVSSLSAPCGLARTSARPGAAS